MKGLVKFSYAKVIDSASVKAWEQLVFEDTYKEFFMQAQLFDPQRIYSSFTELLSNNPDAKDMHYLVSTAAIGYLRQLGGIIPDITNTLGKTFLPFHNFKFEVLQSHTKDKSKHKVMICFYSETLTWIDTIDKYIMLTIGDKIEQGKNGLSIPVEMMELKSGLSISSWQPIAKDSLITI